MQIDKTDALMKTAVIAGAIGVTVAAPYLGIFIVPFLNPLLKEVATAGLGTVTGVGSNALWDLRGSLMPSHENEDLTRLLANAYSDAIEDILLEAENNQAYGNFNDLIKFILPSIKDEIDIHLKTSGEIDLMKLFPTKENLIEIELDGQKKVPFYKRLLGKNSIEYKPVGNELLTNITSEEFILKLSDDREMAKRVVAEEVEITLRRWFVQLNPKLAQDYSFPPVLDKFVFEKIGELIPQKINRLVKQDNLKPSWKAFQRSHLQAILEQVNNLDNGLSEDDRKLLRPLGDVLAEFSENNELLQKLADGTSNILAKVGESEENIKNCIAEERDKLQVWLEQKLDEILAVGKRTESITKEMKEDLKIIKEKLTQVVAPEKEGIELDLVSLPDLRSNIYGRDDEITEILNFLENETKHGTIVLPTCFGKTSLITKFLQTTTDAVAVKAEHHGLFEKIIYIFCYQNQSFQQIIKPFASLMGKKLEYQEGDEDNFLKQDVFDQIQKQKILLIIDNFESWIDENDKYLNDDVRVFLETLLSCNHQIRTLFVSQKLPHSEKGFSKKIEEIKAIEQALLKGLDEKSAIELVRTEGDEEDFKFVSDDDLRGFFNKVFYIPQAIQSMLWFIDNEGISFGDFMNNEWNTFQTAESDLTDIEKQIPKELRPTRALLVHQIGKLDENSQHLLCLTAFFDGIVPEEILLADFGKYKKTELRKPLDRLKKHQLILTETDALPETDETTGNKTVIHYYQLHGFVRNIIQTMFPDFAANNFTDLIIIATQMYEKYKNAWEKKLFDKQLALVECWERLENYLVVDQKMSDRQYYLDLIDFNKAVAQGEIAFAVNQSLSSDEIAVRVKNIEKLYRRWLEKYPNDAKAYYNLGNLLDEDEARRAEAEANYNKAIALNPNDAKAYYNLGNLLVKDEARRAEAEANYNKAIALNPNDADAYNNLGNLLVKDEARRAEAEANYNKAIALNPNYAEAYNNLGTLLFKDEARRAEAEANFNKAIALNPNDAKAYNNLGILLGKDEARQAEAEANFNKAIALNPNDALAYFNLACFRSLSRKEENKDEAFEFLRKAIKLDSKYKAMAKTDADFDFIRDDARFVEIVGGDDGK